MIDLHTHSTFSDGLCTPTQLVEGAAERGITSLAISDHDTTAGWAELVRVAALHNIEPISAVELGSDYTSGSLHILGYMIDPANRILRQHLDWLQQGRVARNEEIFSKLNLMGLRLRWDEVEREAQGGVIGRLHFAKAMVNRGYVPNVKEAFMQYLGKARRGFVPRRTLDPVGCIELIHEAGGLAVVAHPCTLELNAALFHDLFSFLTDHGLDGIEVYYPQHTERQVKNFIRLANEFGLLITGGSDFHDARSEVHRLGIGALGKPIPESLVDGLKAQMQKIGS